MFYHHKETGSVLVITLIFLAVVALLTFSASVNSQLQQRMSHQFQLKMMADQAADAGVVAFYEWISSNPEYWESAHWPTGEWVDFAKQSYFHIPEAALIWQTNQVTLNVEGAIINQAGALSETHLRVRFYRSLDSGNIHLDHWMELY